MTKWIDPHDKFLDAIALVRLTLPESGQLGEDEHFAMLVEDSSELDKIRMIACLASLCGLIIKEDIFPDGIPQDLSDIDRANEYLDGWMREVVNAEFIDS